MQGAAVSDLINFVLFNLTRKDAMANGLFMQFDTLTAVTDPPVRPKAGTTYLYQWSDGSKRNNW